MTLPFTPHPLAGRHSLRRCAQICALAATTVVPLAVSPLHAVAQSDTTAEQQRKTIPKSLEEMVVVGQPSDSLLNAVDLERRQANDLDDLFTGISSVRVGGSVPAAQKIYVRNLGEDTLNIMIDGATQSGVTYHHTGRITLEPELLKQVEVSVGAGEATNGPGALGGSIRFETKDPDDLLHGERFGALVKTGYFSNTHGTKNSISLYGQLTDGLSAMVSYVGADSGNIEDANGDDLPGTESKQDLGFAKIVADLGYGHRLRFSHEQLDEEGYKLNRPEWAASPGNPLRFLEFTRETNRVNYTWDAPDNDWIDLDLNVYRTEFDIYREFDDYTSLVDSWGATLSNTSRLGNHTLTYGVDYRDDEVTAGEKSDPDEFEETSDVLGFFVQDHYQLTDDLLLSFGTRYDQFEANDKAGNRFTDEGFSPNANFAYTVLPGLTLSGGYSVALRGVETNDGFKLFGTTNDPDLKAEKAKNLEFGLDYELGRFVFSVGRHDVVIEDAIGNAVPWSRHYQNLGDLESDGYTLGIAYQGDKLLAKVNYLHTKAELEGEELTRYAYGYLGTSTGDTLAFDLNYQLLPSVSVGWFGQLVEGLDNIYVEAAEASIDKPGYGVHDLYAQWLPEAVEGLTLTLTVKNVFDKDYLDHGSIEDFTHLPDYDGVTGARSAGRDIRISAAYQF